MAASVAVGFLACAICTIFFGSMFVPLKKFDTKDGMFVQWVMGCAIFCVGLVVGGYECFQNFYPLAMLGGAFWATGNITAIPIINRIGMALGILLWSFTNLLSGWASGRFGWFGIKPQIPQNELLNYFGLILSLISTIMFAFVKNEQGNLSGGNGTAARTFPNEDASPILAYEQVNSEEDPLGDDGVGKAPPMESRISVVNRQQQRLMAIIASIVAGIFYGLCFAPVIYIQDNKFDAPKGGLPYVFAFCCGVFATSTVYFIIYAVYKQNKPLIVPEVALPAFAAGIMWAIAQTAFFIANEALSEAVSFPIVTRFPGLIAALWGVFVFKEIRVKGHKGRKNLLVLGIAMAITVLGGVLSGLSKIM